MNISPAANQFLIHAPIDSFVTWYFKTHEIGQVVDQPDPAQMATAIHQIINNHALRTKWRKNALERARLDFSVEVSRAKFISVLGI